MNLNSRLGRYRSMLGEDVIDAAYYDDDELAPVMPAIDAVQQLMEEEDRIKTRSMHNLSNGRQSNVIDQANEPVAGTSKQTFTQNNTETSSVKVASKTKVEPNYLRRQDNQSQHISVVSAAEHSVREKNSSRRSSTHKVSNERESEHLSSSNNLMKFNDDEVVSLVKNITNTNISMPFNEEQKQDEFEFIPKSVTLDVYSNDPEVKRFLRQLPKIPQESGFNEQDYKCYSCRRPIGLVFGQPRLCHFDGHHYCSECHLGEKSVIPARILCNWDFNSYPVSKRNQHFLTLISNEPMFELKKISPLLYKMCPTLRDIEELRSQAFFIRSYCTTCVQDSISFELTKLIWPREHLIKQTDTYSIEDLVQLKSGNLKQILKNVISFGKHHVLSCVLCCQKGFICELCKSSQIIYPFDTDSVHRCNECQSIYHKYCFKSKPKNEECPRCQRLKARRNEA